jgi:hypothetical protein
MSGTRVLRDTRTRRSGVLQDDLGQAGQVSPDIETNEDNCRTGVLRTPRRVFPHVSVSPRNSTCRFYYVLVIKLFYIIFLKRNLKSNLLRSFALIDLECKR